MGVVFSFDQESLSDSFFPRSEGRMVGYRFILRLSLGLNVKDDVEIISTLVNIERAIKLKLMPNEMKNKGIP